MVWIGLIWAKIWRRLWVRVGRPIDISREGTPGPASAKGLLWGCAWRVWGRTRRPVWWEQSLWVGGQEMRTRAIFDEKPEIQKFMCCALVLSCFGHVWLFVTLWTVACQAPLSTGFSRQEYWSGLSFPPPGDLPRPRGQTRVSCVCCTGRQVLYH